MIYKAIGLMSRNIVDGLDIVYTHVLETAGKWSFEVINADNYPYPKHWQEQLNYATSLNALDYQLLHASYGSYIGERINYFIETHSLHHKVDLISLHGYTTFHIPKKLLAQLGDGAAVAAATGLPVISDLQAMDVALNGEINSIIPIGNILLPGVLEDVISFKEALIVAMMGVRRWREEYNMLSSVTGASRNSIGGALWLGVEA